MNRSPQQTIIFDLGKVICPFDPRIPCRKLSPLCGLETDDILHRIFFGEIEMLFETGQIDGDEFARRVIDELGLTITPEQLRPIWTEMFDIDRGTLEILTELRPNTQLILLSNTCDWHFTYCENRFGFSKYFDHLVLSYEVGAMKPDERIFRAALDRCTFPDTALFIDDLSKNTEAAELLGIESIQFESPGQLRKELRARKKL